LTCFIMVVKYSPVTYHTTSLLTLWRVAGVLTPWTMPNLLQGILWPCFLLRKVAKMRKCARKVGLEAAIL